MQQDGPSAPCRPLRSDGQRTKMAPSGGAPCPEGDSALASHKLMAPASRKRGPSGPGRAGQELVQGQDRTSANSFSKYCFGRAPMTVFFTSPPWKR